MIAGASQPGAPASVCRLLIVSRLGVSMRVGEALAPTTSASLNLRSCHPGVRKHLGVAPPPGRQLLCTGASKGDVTRRLGAPRRRLAVGSPA